MANSNFSTKLWLLLKFLFSSKVTNFSEIFDLIFLKREKFLFWSKISLLIKNRLFVKNQLFDQNFDLLIKRSIFDQNLDFLTKVSIISKNLIFWPTILGENQNFRQKKVYFRKLWQTIKRSLFVYLTRCVTLTQKTRHF